MDEAINDISKIYFTVTVEYYVIMPDHIHLLIIVHSDENGRPIVAHTVSRLVKQVKGYVSKRIGILIWQNCFLIT